MKTTTRTLPALLFCFAFVLLHIKCYSQTIIATTENGKHVSLNPDNTWAWAENYKPSGVPLSGGGYTADTTKYQYCELVGTQRFLSVKVTLAVDFGEEKDFWIDRRLRDEQTGRVKIFNSMVDGLNYMGDDGWEFVQAYTVTVSQQNVYHWLLKKRR